jgi:hypothetical protein
VLHLELQDAGQFDLRREVDGVTWLRDACLA